MKVICDLEVPRTDEATGIPTAWVRDRRLSAAARGAACVLLLEAPPGSFLDTDELSEPVSEAVRAELIAAGYLRHVQDDEWELTHPSSLPPLY